MIAEYELVEWFGSWGYSVGWHLFYGDKRIGVYATEAEAKSHLLDLIGL